MKVWGHEVYGKSLSSSQFYCEPKTAPMDKDNVGGGAECGGGGQGRGEQWGKNGDNCK